MDSRPRGNDINGIFAVIPAKAGIHTAYPNTNASARTFHAGDAHARSRSLRGSQAGSASTVAARGSPTTSMENVDPGAARCGST